MHLQQHIDSEALGNKAAQVLLVLVHHPAISAAEGPHAVVSQGLTQPDSGWAVIEPLAAQLVGVARAQQLAVVWPLSLAIK